MRSAPDRHGVGFRKFFTSRVLRDDSVERDEVGSVNPECILKRGQRFIRLVFLNGDDREIVVRRRIARRDLVGRFEILTRTGKIPQRQLRCATSEIALLRELGE